MKRLGIITVLFFACSVFAANPLPASRTPGGIGSWTGVAGVPGGIPNRTTIFTNFSPGATFAQVQNGINLCPSNQVVHLAAGTYLFQSTLVIDRSGVTVRGDTNQWGQPTTIITNNADAVPLLIGDTAWYSDFHTPQADFFHAWTNGYTQGTNIITLSNTVGLVVGQLCYLDQLNDADTTAYSPANPDGPYVSGEYSSLAHPNLGYDRIQFQVNRIAAINGNQVTLYEPIYMPNWDASLAPELWATPNGNLVCMSGFENLSLFTDGQSTNPNDCTFMYAYGCWALNCWASMHITSHAGYFYMINSLRPEIRHCYMHDEEYGPADRYGLQTKVTSGALVTDNIASGNTVLCMMNGSSGSVWSYNYSFTNMSQTTDNGTVNVGLYTHGGTPNMDLCEGNQTSQAQLDDQWQNSSYMTIFRNRLPGVYAIRVAGGQGTGIESFKACATNRHASVIGNCLGRAGIDTHYEISGLGATQFDGSRVYLLGYTVGAWDAEVTNTLIRAVNWTSATLTNNGITLDGGYTTNDLPASLYLASAPANWGNLPWPGIDPNMGAIPDISTNISPAVYRMNFSFTNGGPGIDPNMIQTNIVTASTLYLPILKPPN